MANPSDRLVWVDCEMTGLDLERDELLEVAVIVTDSDLTVLDDGLTVVIKPSHESLENMSDFVRTMHQKSGLLEELADGMSLADAEYAVNEYVLSHVPDEGQAPLAGNSIGTDRAFLAKYMPRVDSHLHYRNIDVSSIKELSRRWFPRVYFNAPEKDGDHRAKADILESIRELQYYRRAAFVADPGPTTVEARLIASQVMADFPAGL
ncbi:MAG: oligoribonuclease [Cryobacterium sp.]|nr:oligoribonuclease [Cryobacterium sp.]